MNPKAMCFTVAVATALWSPFASAHFDFKPEIKDGKIVTAGHDDSEGIDVSPLIVGGYDFGETPGDPYNISDPGFNTLGSSSFQGGSTIRYQALAVEGRYLSYWDGIGDPSFGAVPAGISLNIAGSPSRRVSLTESAAVYAPASNTSLLIGTLAGNGALHVHLSSSIFFEGDQVEGSVPAGAYLISFELLNPGTGIANSDPLFIVFNNGLDEEAHDAAIDYVSGAYVPEPASAGLAAFGLAALVRRRR